MAAYDKAYLNDVQNSHIYLFCLMGRSKEYDTLSMIDAFMQYSEIQEKVDKGNWSALNKSAKQLYNSIPLKKCIKNSNQQQYDDLLLEWMANMYVLMQWKYNISSKELNVQIPAKKMLEAYYPLHETSYDNACTKLYLKYLNKNEAMFNDDNKFIQG